jgi:hypothetical protein
VRCFHAEGAAGDDWFRLVNERIEAALRENARSTPPPPRVELAGAPRSAPLSRASSDTGHATRQSRPITVLVRQRPFALLALLAAFVIALSFAKGRADVWSAERELDAIAEALDARSRLAGGYPAALDELGWRLPPIVGGTEAVDPWGRALRYRAPGPGGSRFELRSLGPDGVPSNDDLVRR